jgi:glycosyltransferase involved in cell wall biosynthesis
LNPPVVQPSHSPVLSVIIPTYNRAESTLRAVASVWKSVEKLAPSTQILVVDDGSEAEQLTRLRTGLAQSPRAEQIRLLEPGRRADPAAMRNVALREAKSPWVAFLDSDDEWTPSWGQAIETAVSEPGLSLVVGNRAQPIEGDPLRLLLRINFFTTSAVLVRRELLLKAGGFPEGYFFQKHPFVGWEDYEAWLTALALLDQKGELGSFRVAQATKIKRAESEDSTGRASLRTQMWRELFTLAKVAHHFPSRLWGAVLRRFLGAAKGALWG